MFVIFNVFLIINLFMFIFIYDSGVLLLNILYINGDIVNYVFLEVVFDKIYEFGFFYIRSFVNIN